MIFNPSNESPYRRYALGIAVALVIFAGTDAYCANVKQEMTAAVDAVRPALIRIHVVSTDYRQGREMKIESFGSGVIISPEGYAVTNHHVAADAERIMCTLADKREVDAKLVGTDPLADIAVIKLISPDGKPFPSAQWGDSSKLEVGDYVYAMGCPYALSQSVTMGMVSNTELVMPPGSYSECFELDGEDVGSIVRWIGHDALIRPGNSGGPLVDRTGKIVGINEISFGLSGAIPSNLARKVVEQIIEKGKVTRSWLGLEVQPLLESSGLERGVLVSGILEGSPADKAGFRSGDILLRLAGQEVTARFREEIPLFNQFVADLAVGKPVQAVVLRDGKEQTLTVVPVEREKATDKQHELRSWGICCTNITYLMQKEMRRETQDGVLVTSVLPSGPAGSAKPSLREQDVITSVGGQPVKDVAALRSVTKQLTEGKEEPTPVVVQFERKLKHYATVVKIGKNEQSKAGAEISKAWLPIDFQVLTRELAEALGVPNKTGVRITQVYPESSASKAGLMVGDIILKLDGEDIPAEQEGDEDVLPSLIRQYDVGSKVKLDIVRDGKPMSLEVELEASPRLAQDLPRYENDDFEFTARDIAFEDWAAGNVPRSQAGALVESVKEGGWAAVGMLRSGDTITAVDRVQITNLDDLKRALEQVAQKKPKTVVFEVRRGIHTVFLEIEPSWPEL